MSTLIVLLYIVLQGCNHDRGAKNACASDLTNFNYGFRDPSANFRSILAYNCASGQCDGNAGGGCSRVQRFSNDEYLYNSQPIGSASEDNARKINEVAATVAGYYPCMECGPTVSPELTAQPTATPVVPAPTARPMAAPVSPEPTAQPTAAPVVPACIAAGYGCDRNTNCCTGLGQCTKGKPSERVCL